MFEDAIKYLEDVRKRLMELYDPYTSGRNFSVEDLRAINEAIEGIDVAIRKLLMVMGRIGKSGGGG